MRKPISKIHTLLIVILILTSCEKDQTSGIEVDNPSNFIEIFDSFWQNMNSNYNYWDLDSTNWDQIYIKYAPKFENLNLNNPKHRKQSVQLFQEMTRGLIDGHFQINFSNTFDANTSINPHLERKINQPDYHKTYSFIQIDTTYLDKSFKLSYDTYNQINGQPLTVLCGKINNSTLYFHCNGFALVKSYELSPDNRVRNCLNYFFEQLPKSDGVIIDLRNNRGGNIADLNFLLGNFTKTNEHFGYTQYKSGIGKLEFTPWIEANISPKVNLQQVNQPIVILANIHSASLSETIIIALKAVSNCICIGETTWGATGSLTDHNLYNSGSFEVANIMSVQASSCKFKDKNNNIFEGIGINPDIYIPFSMVDYENGRDLQLEKAIQNINSQ